MRLTESLMLQSSEIPETDRLAALLPPELQSRVAIVRAHRSSTEHAAAISTKRIERNRYVIQIDLEPWHQFDLDQRNLLFWHEVARIRSRTVARSSWEGVAMGTGLSVALMELVSQNVLSFAVALTVTGLAAYQLYQRRLGEQCLRAATTADQQAIELATEFGYSSAQASDSLYAALKLLSKRSVQKLGWKKYQVRLRVLEMLAAKSQAALQRTERSIAQLPASMGNMPLDVLSYHREISRDF